MPPDGPGGFSDTRPLPATPTSAATRAALDWIVEVIPLPALLLDAEFRVVTANARLCAVLGYTRDELVGADAFELYSADDTAQQAERRTRAIRSRGEVLVEERHALARDGRRLWMRVHMRAVEIGGHRHYSAALQDFEEAGARGALRLGPSESFRVLFRDAPMPATVQDDQYRIVAANAAFCELTGYRVEELIGRDPLELHKPSSRDQVLAARAMAQLRMKSGLAPDHSAAVFGEQADADAPPRALLCKDGRELPYRLHVRDARGSDGRWFVVVMLSDLTADVAIRARLKRQLDNVRRFLESVPVGLLIRDASHRVMVANRRFVDLAGWASDELIGKPFDFLRGLDERTRQMHGGADAEAALASGSTVRVRMPMMDRSGRRLWTDRTSTRVFDLEGREAVLTVVHDVTAEQQLADDLQRLVLEQGALLRSTAAGVAHVMFGRVVRVNSTLETLLGRPASALQGRPIADLFGRPDVWSRLEQQSREVLQAGGTFDCELPLVGPERRPKVCEARLRLIDASAPDSGMIFTLLDVTALAEARRRFQRFAEVVDEAVVVVDSRLERAYFCNDRIASVLGVTRERFEAAPIDAFGCVRSADRLAIDVAFGRVADHPQQELEVKVDHPSLGERKVRLRVLSAGADLDEVYITAEDVTEVRRIESQRLEDAISQRDMLVREVHHRIKNNLQGVAGLLQQTASRRPEVGDVLREVAAQIQAIAQIHGIQVEAVAALRLVRMVDVVLQGTGRNFGIAFELDHEGRPQLEALEVPEQESVPLALVINELATNAVKHRSSGGKVGARLSPVANGVRLTVWNDGRLTSPIDLSRMSTGTTGLSLVKAMLPRRGTRITFDDSGTRVEVTLELGPPAVRVARSESTGAVRSEGEQSVNGIVRFDQPV